MDEIRTKMFQSALTGIRNKKMTYENDPILPLVQETIKRSVDSVRQLSEEDQNKLITLTKEQVLTLQKADERTKDTFVNKQPLLDASVKEYEQVKDALRTWGQ